MGPSAFNDPEFIHWMVKKHGTNHLDQYPPEMRQAYRRHYATPAGQPLYGVWMRIAEQGKDSGWTPYARCADLSAAERLEAELLNRARRENLPYRYITVALALLPIPDSFTEATAR
jgi:hypothetical protein